MSATTIAGALLLIAGIVVMARAAIARGRMSDPRPNPGDTGRTLEPRRRDLGFLGLRDNWPGLAVAGAGALLLLFPLVL